MEAPHGHDEKCEHCGEPCDAFAGNPSLWPTPLYSKVPGKVGYWHMGCASKRLRQLEGDIAKYRARLEVDHFYVKEPGASDLVRQDVPYTSADDDIGDVDGISCRDATIALLEDDLREPAAKN